ncbi:hypothetical protein GCM10028778_26620 [Barrientosiimonas marina]|uniref:ABC transporter permease n=1 Tax=Lentibacillus kimchii TaxID=1542911 RepID=A0ABW2USR0_9BACI
MMYLTKPSLFQTVKQQCRFKLKSFSGFFTTLMILQLIAFVLSLFSTGSSTTSLSRGMHIYVDSYSASIVVVFTMLWGFISAVQMKTQMFRDDDFVFVSSHLSHDLANMIFLTVTSLLGGITALLYGFLLKVVTFFLFSATPIMQGGFTDTVGEWLMGALAAFMFILMFSSAGYLVGTFVHLYKMFAYIIPAVIIGLLFFWPRITGGDQLLLEIGTFYFEESSFLLFMCKTLLTALVLFAGSIIIYRRLEVRT